MKKKKDAVGLQSIHGLDVFAVVVVCLNVVDCFLFGK